MRNGIFEELTSRPQRDSVGYIPTNLNFRFMTFCRGHMRRQQNHMKVHPAISPGGGTDGRDGYVRSSMRVTIKTARSDPGERNG